jgi:hypothetical protein
LRRVRHAQIIITSFSDNVIFVAADRAPIPTTKARQDAATSIGPHTLQARAGVARTSPWNTYSTPTRVIVVAVVVGSSSSSSSSSMRVG